MSGRTEAHSDAGVNTAPGNARNDSIQRLSNPLGKPEGIQRRATVPSKTGERIAHDFSTAI